MHTNTDKLRRDDIQIKSFTRYTSYIPTVWPQVCMRGDSLVATQLYEEGYGGDGWLLFVCMGARSNCILGGRIEWLFNPARRHDGRWETSSTQIVHLAIIQAWYTSSSRVLLVSNLRRSNWKCTVKRFFKSTVMKSYQHAWEAMKFCGYLFWW